MRGILTFAEFRNLRRFTSLDGLRGISILLVFTAHPVAREYWLFFHGTTGVTIFFVLSGFLITTLLLREEDKYGRVDLVGFYIRRLFRIYPMFFGVFLLYCVLILGLGWEAARRGAFEANIPFFLLLFPEHSFFFNEATASVPFSMSWSIGIEEKFYLLWPILGFTLLVGIRKIRPYVLVALAASTWALSFLPNHWGDAIAPYTHIVFGALVATLLHSERGYAWLSRLGRPPVLAAVAVLALVLQFGTNEIEWETGGRLYIAYGLVIACLVAGVVTTRSRGVRILESRFLVYTGALSYVLYLIHNFGLNAAELLVPSGWGLAGSLLSTALGLSAAYLAAAIIHRYYEDPLRRLGARIAKRRRASRSEADVKGVQAG